MVFPGLAGNRGVETVIRNVTHRATFTPQNGAGYVMRFTSTGEVISQGTIEASRDFTVGFYLTFYPSDGGTVFYGRMSFFGELFVAQVPLPGGSTFLYVRDPAYPDVFFDGWTSIGGGGVHVSVSPPTADVHKGGEQPFSATVTPASTSQDVTWTVTGGGTGTSINSSGLLTVGTNETAGTELTVRATSVAGSRRYGTATIKVTASPTAQTPSISGQPQDAFYRENENTAQAITVSVQTPTDGGML